MSLLYCTADRIGIETGGGLVTAQESLAFKEFANNKLLKTNNFLYSDIDILSQDNLGSDLSEPWKWDEVACQKIDHKFYKLSHFYSGTFGKTVLYLKGTGAKVIYTIAAHDKEISRKEHEKIGLPFPYTHLTDNKLWKRYIEGYNLADIIVCPSTVSANTVRKYGPTFEKKDIRVIPHGCHLPKETKALPSTFIVGYAGSFGCDKGVRYLLDAWKKLNYKDGSLLILAGKDSVSPIGRYFVSKFGGGSIRLAGWQTNMSDFYNSISLYIQPSATEGYGLEVLEAAAHKRPVLVSDNAGAVDLVNESIYKWSFPSCDSDKLAAIIDSIKAYHVSLTTVGEDHRRIAEKYTWDNVRTIYRNLWNEVS